MFEICVDKNGYYTEEHTEYLVSIDEMPEVTDVRFLKAYKYNSGSMKKDEEKYAEIAKEIGDVIALPTTQDQLDAMASAIIELAGMLGGV